MSRNAQLFTVDNYKFRIFDPVPRAGDDKALVLFKEGGDLKKRLLITAQKPALGSEVRAGGYNRIMEIALGWNETEVHREIADESNNFRFFVSVTAQYRVKDPLYIFENRPGSVDGELQRMIVDAVQGAHKKYEIESQIELERDLRGDISKRLGSLGYLETGQVDVTADLDERAKTIIDSSLDALAQSAIGRNKSERLSQEIEEQKTVEINRLEAGREIEKARNELNLEKAAGLKALERGLGEDYSTVLSYLNGEISNVQLDERLYENRKQAMAAKLEYFKELVAEDVLSGPALERAAMKLLGEESMESTASQQALADRDAERSEAVVEDTEEYL